MTARRGGGRIKARALPHWERGSRRHSHTSAADAFGRAAPRTSEHACCRGGRRCSRLVYGEIARVDRECTTAKRGGTWRPQRRRVPPLLFAGGRSTTEPVQVDEVRFERLEVLLRALPANHHDLADHPAKSLISVTLPADANGVVRRADVEIARTGSCRDRAPIDPKLQRGSPTPQRRVEPQDTVVEPGLGAENVMLRIDLSPETTAR